LSLFRPAAALSCGSKRRDERATRETPARPPERSWGSSAAFISWFTSVRSAVMRQNRVSGRPRGALGCPLERSGAPTEAVLERVTTAQHPRLPYLSRADGFSVAASSISARHSSELAVVDGSPESGRSSFCGRSSHLGRSSHRPPECILGVCYPAHIAVQ